VPSVRMKMNDDQLSHRHMGTISGHDESTLLHSARGIRQNLHRRGLILGLAKEGASLMPKFASAASRFLLRLCQERARQESV